MHSIRVKITAITVAAILTSMISVLSACYFTIKPENDRGTVEKMNLIAKDAKNALEKYLENIQQSVELSANIALDALDGVRLVEYGIAGARAGQKPRTREQSEALDKYLADYSERVQQTLASVAGYTYGIVTYYYCFAPEISETQHGFYYSRVGKTGFFAREPLDARALDANDAAQSAWYYTPIQRGRPSWVGPYNGDTLNGLLIYSYLVPIYKAGTLIGVLGMDIPFATLVEQISSIRVYETGFASLFDTDMRVLYHPILPFDSRPDMKAIGLTNESLKQQNNGNELIRYHANGEERQLSFTTLSNGLKLVIGVTTREINAAWTRLTGILLIVTAAILVFYAALLLLVMNIITRPLQRLTAASQRLAAGDYDVALKYNSRDEVGQLTKAFTQMRGHMKDYIDDLNRRVYMDDLTGLPNMKYFFKLALAEKKRLIEEDKQPALLYFDLIGMKFYNRQYGFEEGNKLLCAIAEILTRHYGSRALSRYGQDHFAAVTDETGMEDELRAIFRECAEANGGRSLPVRVGIYLNRLEDVAASIACDRAKFACDQQRGLYMSAFYYFDTSMLRQAENYRYILSHLDEAIEKRWIKVYYQPIVRAANGLVCDEEALSRWIDPVKGPLSPIDFIPVLENARLIYKLDLYVLDQILLKMKAQKASGLHLVPQSLNLSRADFEVCDIVEEIRMRVDDSGIPRELLTIEVTESTVGKDPEFLKQQVQRFQSLGFQVWMDDFGSGYSALDVLQDIHFDLIKFDMRFMQRFDESDESRIILTELTKMAISLGIETVCEGVETQAQVEFLREIGCTKLQGYYYCKPIPFEQIIERNRKGIQIGFENPEEAEYYAAIGRINLYDLSTMASDGGENMSHFFDTLPMAVIESDGRQVQFIRSNKAYRDFMTRTFESIKDAQKVDHAQLEAGVGAPFVHAMRQCREEGSRVFIHEKLPSGEIIHAMLKHIAVNPVTGILSCVAVVLGITDAGAKDEQNASWVRRLEKPEQP